MKKKQEETQNQNEVETLEEEIQEIEEEDKQEGQTYLDDLKRVQAEFENYMKRVEKERMLIADYGKRDLLLKLLNVVDEFDVAISSMKQSEDKEEILKGVEMLSKHLGKMLESEHVRKIEALGKRIDPYCHEVVAQIEGQDGMVVEEVKKGYMFKDKLLRASIVKVGGKI